MKFKDEIRALLTQYDKNYKIIKNESTIEIFSNILKVPGKQIRPTFLNNVQLGKFYIIRYNYNGNKIWCPILTIPPLTNQNELGIIDNMIKIKNTKKILYAVNFDYLPLRFKVNLIENIIKNNLNKYEKNIDKISEGRNVKEEFNFKLNWIYRFLKVKEKSYAITAYDISKIEKIFEVSSTILHRFIFLDTYYVNKKMMYDTLNNIENEKIRSEFSNKINTFEEILKLYEKDVEYFYTALRSFEKNLKFIDEEL